MSFRLIAVLVVLILQFSGCATRSDRAAGVDELERRHADTVKTIGGSGM
jgi:hypothetical protein